MTQVNSPCCANQANGPYRPGEVAMWRTDGKGRTHIDATRYDDQISVTRVPGRHGQWFKVSVNNQYMYLSRDQTKKLVIHGGRGNDRVRIGPGVPSGVQVYGGTGNDVVHSQSNGTFMHGGPGNDVLVNHPAGPSNHGGPGHGVHGHGVHGPNCRGSVMHGGSGNDVLVNRNGRSVMNGGSGNDVLIDQFRRPRRGRRRRGRRKRRIGNPMKNFFKKLGETIKKQAVKWAIPWKR